MIKFTPTHSDALESQASTWIAIFTSWCVFWLHFLCAGALTVQYYGSAQLTLYYYSDIPYYGFSLQEIFITLSILAILVGFINTVCTNTTKWWKTLHCCLFLAFSSVSVWFCIWLECLEEDYVRVAPLEIEYHREMRDTGNRGTDSKRHHQSKIDAIKKALDLYRSCHPNS